MIAWEPKNEAMPINVNLTPFLEEMVRQKVKSGLYSSASEVIREALRLMGEQDSLRQAKFDQLRQDIRAGIESGPATVWDADEIKRTARKRKTTGQTVGWYARNYRDCQGVARCPWYKAPFYSTRVIILWWQSITESNASCNARERWSEHYIGFNAHSTNNTIRHQQHTLKSHHTWR